jgi:hypothetical protein
VRLAFAVGVVSPSMYVLSLTTRSHNVMRQSNCYGTLFDRLSRKYLRHSARTRHCTVAMHCPVSSERPRGRHPYEVSREVPGGGIEALHAVLPLWVKTYIAFLG